MSLPCPPQKRQLIHPPTDTALAATLTAAGYLCPRFQRCNAGFCPLLGGSHLPGERVCFYLREALKDSGQARVEGALHQELARLVLDHAQRLTSESGPLARALRRAAKKGSRMEQGRRAMRRLRAAVAT